MGAGITHVFAGGIPGPRIGPFERRARAYVTGACALAFSTGEALADNVTPCEDLGETVAQTGLCHRSRSQKLEIKRAIFADGAPDIAVGHSPPRIPSVIPIHLIAEGCPPRNALRNALVESGRP